MRHPRQFTPFLDDDPEIRAVLCNTNVVESLNARYRRAVTVRGHFPTEQAALKCLYMVTRSVDPKGTGQSRWTMRWKPALNAFAITFADRMPKAENRQPWKPPLAPLLGQTHPRMFGSHVNGRSVDDRRDRGPLGGRCQISRRVAAPAVAG